MTTTSTRNARSTGRLASLPRHPVLWLWTGVAVVLAALGLGAASTADLERQNASASLRSLGPELAETYEAQTLRELRGIEQVLNLLALAGETMPPDSLLEQLNRRNLLPSPQIYSVRLATAQLGLRGLATDRELRLVPPAPGSTGLNFVRQLKGASEGWQAEVEVDSRFFVSGFDRTRMGLRGMQGLLTHDGTSLVSQSGAQVEIGASMPAEWRNTKLGAFDNLSLRLADGTLRQVWVRPLYGYPLRAFIAVDEVEFNAPAERSISQYRLRTAAVTTVLLLVALAMHRYLAQLHAQRLGLEAERQRRAREVEQMAFRDALTGLPNRRLFHDTAERELSRSNRYQEPLALLFIDLDGFKAVNDTLGHEAGDELLQEVARRMHACLRNSDLLARLGGDEFAVLLPMQSGVQEVGPVAQKLIDAISAPCQLSAGPCTVSASIGVAICPRDSNSLDPLLRLADAAMYEAKRSGKGQWRAVAGAR